jgi:hypothetical protein
MKLFLYVWILSFMTRGQTQVSPPARTCGTKLVGLYHQCHTTHVDKHSTPDESDFSEGLEDQVRPTSINIFKNSESLWMQQTLLVNTGEHPELELESQEIETKELAYDLFNNPLFELSKRWNCSEDFLALDMIGYEDHATLQFTLRGPTRLVIEFDNPGSTTTTICLRK